MGRVLQGMLAGAAAGAAGTTALNAATYLDMAVRGRPASSTPEDTVARLAKLVGVEVPGDEDSRKNRLSGLGALLGLATGTAVGAAAGAVLAASGRRPSTAATAAGIGAAAMLGANAPMAALGVSDPRSWSAAEWLSDIAPHVAYGSVTGAVLRGLRR